jgi:hypothetical protein
MQGGKNRILPKEMNVNRFFWDSHWLKSGQTTFVPLWDRMDGAWQWTLVRSANGDADQIRSANYKSYLTSRIFFLFGPRLYLRSEHSVRK